MSDKTYTVTATLGTIPFEFEDVEAPNKAEAISEAQSTLEVDWSVFEGPVLIMSDACPDGVDLTLADLFGQDLHDLIIEKFVNDAQWTAKRVKS
jgi:hypothetical protein